MTLPYVNHNQSKILHDCKTIKHVCQKSQITLFFTLNLIPTSFVWKLLKEVFTKLMSSTRESPPERRPLTVSKKTIDVRKKSEKRSPRLRS